jgi:hypothetical protein
LVTLKLPSGLIIGFVPEENFSPKPLVENVFAIVAKLERQV